jgi:predicted ATP-dependent serine protease
VLRLSPAATPSNLSAQPDTVTGVAKTRPQYRCSECHHVTAKWVGRCPDSGFGGRSCATAAAATPNGPGRIRSVSRKSSAAVPAPLLRVVARNRGLA